MSNPVGAGPTNEQRTVATLASRFERYSTLGHPDIAWLFGHIAALRARLESPASPTEPVAWMLRDSLAGLHGPFRRRDYAERLCEQWNAETPAPPRAPFALAPLYARSPAPEASPPSEEAADAHILTQMVLHPDGADRDRWFIALDALWAAKGRGETPTGGPLWTITRLRSALENWGKHHPWCVSTRLIVEDREPCNCGYDEACKIDIRAARSVLPPSNEQVSR